MSIENVKLEEILSILKEIKIKLCPVERPPVEKYPQTCDRCGLEWNCRVEKPVQCPSCHGSMFLTPKQEENILECKALCSQLDEEIRKLGKFEYTNDAKTTLYVFEVAPVGLEYRKYELTGEVSTLVKKENVDGTYQVLIPWGQGSVKSFVRKCLRKLGVGSVNI